MSRWSHWSRGDQERPRFLSNFMAEADTGNPAANSSPAERAQQLGLQSDGSGGYIDPETGETIARTVNGELVFYDNRGASGGAVSDGAGGQELANASPTWSDPMTGMAITPPSRPESPEEQGAIPDPVPATAPAGYDSFVNDRKLSMYQGEQEKQMAQKMHANATADVNNPMQAAPNPGITPIQPDGNVYMGPGLQGGLPGVQEAIGDNSDMKQKTGQMPVSRPGKTFAQMRQQMQSGPEPSMPAEPAPSTIDDYSGALGGVMGRNITDQSELAKKRDKALQPLRSWADNPDTDPKTRGRIMSLGTRLMKESVGGRKDKKLNEPNDETVDGMLERGEALKEAFAADPKTGYPNLEKVQSFMDETLLYGDTPKEALDAFWKSIPSDMKSNWGGQGTKARERFDNWVCRDGKCSMSGAYLHPEHINHDHQIPHSTTRNSDLPKDLKDYVLSQDNLWMIHKSLNQLMGSKDKDQFVDEFSEEFGGEKRIENLQDYLYNLNKDREEIHGNLPQMLEDTLTDSDDEGKYLKEGVGMEGVDGAVQMAQHRQEEMMTTIMDKFTEQFDPDGLLSTRKVPEEMKAKKQKLQRAQRVIKSISKQGGLTPLFRALGVPTTFRADSQRGGSFTGMDSILRGVMGQMAGQPKEKQREVTKQWSEMLSASNTRASDKWDEIHADDTLSGMDKEQRLSTELEYKKEAARHVAQQASDMGYLDMDSLEDGTEKKALMELFNREALYEENEESALEFTDEFDLRELLELLQDLMDPEEDK